MPVGHPLSTAESYEDDEEDVPPNQEGVSPFLHLIGQVRAYLHLPAPEAPSLSYITGVERAQGSVLPRQPSFSLPRLLMAQTLHEEAQCRSLKELMPCSANFQLSRDWYGWARSFYLPEGTSLAPPPVNEELGGLRPVGNPAVSVSSWLLAQMEKVCGFMADIAFWTDWVLATWAGATSSMEQVILKFLLALVKANKDILRPAEELRCRLLMLLRQMVVDSLPRTFSDREKRQLLSFPFSDVLFDPMVVAKVQKDEHLATQHHALFSMVRVFASFFGVQPLGPGGAR
ncbi:hypothetical protein E2C01_067587 [Portunus trituberculatus]|uniref:Uncharacterized protein n=1 Tax=Portunus trituberculatus TaxID=210409 RepID=A0A5B7HXU0_PORTR|nr:hypothetical protein [Portunus trituberculatus]